MVVIRPDSGNPSEVIIRCLEILGEKFGYRENDKGFKVLLPYVRLLQGDGITRRSLTDIMANVVGAGWSLENLSFGSGGGLLQDCNRDTLRFALKCSWAVINDAVVGRLQASRDGSHEKLKARHA